MSKNEKNNTNSGNNNGNQENNSADIVTPAYTEISNLGELRSYINSLPTDLDNASVNLVLNPVQSEETVQRQDGKRNYKRNAKSYAAFGVEQLTTKVFVRGQAREIHTINLHSSLADKV